MQPNDSKSVLLCHLIQRSSTKAHLTQSLWSELDQTRCTIGSSQFRPITIRTKRCQRDREAQQTTRIATTSPELGLSAKNRTFRKSPDSWRARHLIPDSKLQVHSNSSGTSIKDSTSQQSTNSMKSGHDSRTSWPSLRRKSLKTD